MKHSVTKIKKLSEEYAHAYAFAKTSSELILARKQLHDAIEAHVAKIEADARDAARYRWLRSRPVEVPLNGPDLASWSDHEGEAIRGDKADAAIDAAMAGEVKS